MMHSNGFNVRPPFMAPTPDHLGLSPHHPSVHHESVDTSSLAVRYPIDQRQGHNYPPPPPPSPSTSYHQQQQWPQRVQYPSLTPSYYASYPHIYQLGQQANGNYSAPAMSMGAIPSQGEVMNSNVTNNQGKNARKRYFDADSDSSVPSQDESNKRMAVLNFYGSASPSSFTPQRQAPSTLYCELCRIKCSGKDAYEQHLAGARHKKAELNESLTSQNSSLVTGLKCDLCNIVCSGPDAYNAHIAGSKHSKAIKVAKSMGKEIPAIEPINISKKPAEAQVNTNASDQTTTTSTATATATTTIITAAPTTTSVSNDPCDEAVGLITSIRAQQTSESKQQSSEPQAELDNEIPLDLTSISDSDNQTEIEEQPLVIAEPVAKAESKTLVIETPAVLAIENEAIGEDYIKEFSLGGKASSFYCELCDCKMGDSLAKQQHVRGKRHRTNHRRKAST